MPEPFLSMWSSSGAILNPSQLLTLSLKPALCSVGDTDCWRPYSQIFIPVILLWSTLPWWDASLVDCNVNSLQTNLCGYKKQAGTWMPKPTLTLTVWWWVWRHWDPNRPQQTHRHRKYEICLSERLATLRRKLISATGVRHLISLVTTKSSWP